MSGWRPPACFTISLLLALVATAGAEEPASQPRGLIDWSRAEGIDPHRADVLDFLDTDLAAYVRLGEEAHRRGRYEDAAFAYLAAVRHPDLFKGVIALAGIFPEEQITAEENARASKKVRLFIGHGKQDPAVAFADGIKYRDLLVRLGYDVTFAEFQGGHHVDPATLRQAVAWIAKEK